jgi:hypothetical protein
MKMMADASSEMHHLRHKACLSLNQFLAAALVGECISRCDNSRVDLFRFQISPHHAHLFTYSFFRQPLSTSFFLTHSSREIAQKGRERKWLFTTHSRDRTAVNVYRLYWK